MAGTSLLALIDDITSVLDDMSVLTKVAARKTTGVLGDDLALNAQQVAGVNAERELPVVWAVAKGSLRNKLILVPAALAISALAPWAITPLLMLGGAFLCFEGFEKLAHTLLHRAEVDAHHAELAAALANPEIDLVTVEQDKINGAIRTDFILSAEIIVITLGTVATASFGMQVAVLAGIAVLMTIGVYGLVAAIVKLDDGGLYLSRQPAGLSRALGCGILAAAPAMMKTLSVVGTAAMFMVGGGILVHGMPGAHDMIHAVAHAVETVPAIGRTLASVAPLFIDALAGIVAGALILGSLTAARRLFRSSGPLT
jgi:predicted DNA repair protein MutK